MTTWPMLGGFHFAFHYSTLRYLHGSLDKFQVAAPSGTVFEMMLAGAVGIVVAAVVGVDRVGVAVDAAAGVAVDRVAVTFAVH